MPGNVPMHSHLPCVQFSYTLLPLLALPALRASPSSAPFAALLTLASNFSQLSSTFPLKLTVSFADSLLYGNSTLFDSTPR